MQKNVAFKLTYNDGGRGEFVGFSDICSHNNIRYNIESGRVRCNNSECRTYYDSNFSPPIPQRPCDESRLFLEWRFGAGKAQTGPNKGKGRHLKQTEKGKLTILTTRFPGSNEGDRKIVGLFEIDSIIDEGSSQIYAHANHRIRIPEDVAMKLNLWDYYSCNSEMPMWDSGLFRYMDDSEVHPLLNAIDRLIADKDVKNILSVLYRCIN